MSNNIVFFAVHADDLPRASVLRKRFRLEDSSHGGRRDSSLSPPATRTTREFRAHSRNATKWCRANACSDMNARSRSTTSTRPRRPWRPTAARSSSEVRDPHRGLAHQIRIRRQHRVRQTGRAGAFRIDISVRTAEQLGREVALHPVGEDGDDMGVGPRRSAAIRAARKLRPELGRRETLANQARGRPRGLVVGQSSSTSDPARKAA